MPAEGTAPRSFKIEGRAAALRLLAATIADALEKGAGHKAQTRRGSLLIEVRVEDLNDLRPAIDNLDDAATLLEGWAEPKRCLRCGKLVALLFDDEYIQSVVAEGKVACLDCARAADDRGESV